MGWDEIVGTMRGAKSTIREAKRISPAPGDQGFTAGDSYFSVHINELFLKNEREWFTRYDPVVFVLSEHFYGDRDVSVPFVVGPKLIQGKIEASLDGMAFTDTQVVGPHPYPGGSFALTVLLARVETTDHAKSMLQFLEETSNAFAKFGGEGTPIIDLSGQVKIAQALFTGFKGLMGLEETQSLVGQRMVYDSKHSVWFQTGTYALINEDIAKVDWNTLSAENGRLLYNKDGHNHRFRDRDFVLFSLSATKYRDDWERLDFNAAFDKLVKSVYTKDNAEWTRIKAGLSALCGDIQTSPDLTWNQSGDVVLELIKRFSEARDRANAVFNLSVQEQAERPDEAATGIKRQNPDVIQAIDDIQTLD